MKASKLKSGNWNVQVFSHYEDMGDGTKRRRNVSFTAPTKSEALRKAAEFVDGKKLSAQPQNMTVAQCIDKYIQSKENVLSPSTVRKYRQMQRADFGALEGIQIGRLTAKDVQYFISDLSARKSPKTVKNVYALLAASVELFSGRRFKVTLPARVPVQYSIPVDSEVAQLMAEADPQLKLCIALAAIGTLRRGEICGLKYKDVLRDFGAVFVHTDMVQAPDGSWVHKEIPKTSSSVRRVDLPAEVIALIGDGDPEELIYKGSPDSMTSRFRRLVNKCGLKCRFHDLRHYAASVMHAIGVPDVYIMERGGWKSDTVLKSVYRNSLSDKQKEFTSLTNEYFKRSVLGEPAAREKEPAKAPGVKKKKSSAAFRTA